MRGRPGPCGCGCALTPKTSLGFSAVEFAEQVLGFDLLPWQRWLLIHAMELRADGRFRFRTVLVLVARQAGKTTLVEVKNLWKMFVLQVPLVIGTAQNLDISEESWDKAVEIVESVPELAAEIKHIDKTNGKKALKLTNGSRWKIAAASRKGGRGLSGDDVNLDELREHHTWESWAAVTKTTMARSRAQIWAYSNAGDDRSVVLNNLQDKGREVAEKLAELLARMVVAEAEEIARQAAEQGIDTSLGLFEWSAPDNCPVDDPQMWRLANPSLGYPQGISVEALQAAMATDPEPIFRTECLCQRVPDLVPSKIPLTAWVNCRDPKSQIAGPVILSWDVSWDQQHAAIGVAGLREDGLPHLELIEYRDGTDWVAGRLAEIVRRQQVVSVVVDPSGPAGALLSKVTERLPADLDPKLLTARNMAHACGQLYNAAVARQMRQLGDDRLLEALRKSATRMLADAWAWDRKHSVGDISPLVAVTVALHGLNEYREPPEQPPAPPPVVVGGEKTYGSETDSLASAGF